MDTLFSARALMGWSLFFHTIFTPLGIGLPLLLMITEGLGLRTGDARYFDLARRWTPIVGLLFAVGAISGTVLSFELGLLWPVFMQYAGGIIGMPFSLEGFAFFTEAIFLAIYIYGWRRFRPFYHWLLTIPIVVSSALSAVFVISANAWMNTPDGFRVVNGEVVDVNPWDAMFNAAWLHEAIHGTLASYVVTGFAVAAVYAVKMWRGQRDGHTRLALNLAMLVAAVSIPLQIAAGDFAARQVADLQPEKFAAMEGQYDTERGAPLSIGGIPIDGETRYALEIPNLLSYLGYRDFDAEVTGLNDFPEDERPSDLMVAFTHLSFQAMVGAGFAMLFIAAWYWIQWWRNRRDAWAPGRLLLGAVAVGGLLSFVAIEAGWFVTEFGRQPWVVRGYLLTSEAATDRDGIQAFFVLFILIYLAIAALLIWVLLHWHERLTPAGQAREVPAPGPEEGQHVS